MNYWSVVFGVGLIVCNQIVGLLEHTVTVGDTVIIGFGLFSIVGGYFGFIE